MRWVWVLMVLLVASEAEGRIRLRAQSLNVRRRLNTRPLTESTRNYSVDWTLAADANGQWSNPLTVSYQASEKTEFSINLDTFDQTHWTDHVTLAGTRSLTNGKVFDLAVMPQVTFVTRNGSGVRAGGSVLARWDLGGNAIGTSATWMGGAGSTWDLGGGYGKKLGRWLPHANLTWERPGGGPAFFTILEGVQLRMSKHWFADVSGQHQGLRSGTVDHQVLTTVSWSSSGTR